MKDLLERAHLQELTTRLREPRRFIQVISGPRQVGKTTLVGQALSRLGMPHLSVSADAVAGAGDAWLAQQWQSARALQRQDSAPDFILAVDEVQKVGNWSETVKKLWDQDTREQMPLKVILLGSSRLLLQQGLTESLAGRFETTYMGHWSCTEMEEAFGLSAEQYVWFGGYPGAAHLITDEDRWKSYVRDSLIETTVSRDILMMTRVDKPALLKKVFELGCTYSGQEVAYQKIMGQLQDAGNTTTLSHYVHLLHSAGLLAGLEKYAGTQLRQRSSSPKFQVHNTALLTAQQGKAMYEVTRDHALWGRWVEAAVGAHLMNHQAGGSYTVHYWRSGKHEVDFVLARNEQVVALEVKSGAKQRAPGMEAFQKAFPQAKVLMVGTGAEGIPWQTFLKMNPTHLF